MEAFFKTIFALVIAGGVLIASFYFAYLLLLILFLLVLGTPMYLYFNRDLAFKEDEDD